MTTPPPLTDRAALMRNRHRAAAAGPALFLHEDAAAELEERLNEVNRRFTNPALVTNFPGPWREVLPDAKVVADDEVLDLVPGAHDLVVHAMCLHWSNDPVGQLVQCARALRPDGLFLAVMFGGQTLAELRAALAEAEAAVTGGLSPRVLPMGEIRDLGGLLQRAGLALPVADSVLRKVSYADPLRLLADLRAMGEANALTQRPRHFMRRAVLAEALNRYVQAFSDPDGRVRASFDMVWLTGWKPHESQQKPLRPGSAIQRLADALNTCALPQKDTPES
ncbi:methyltransferase domain-containing protein [Paenirhodobacter sp. CAU 1674]|uniref:methyltransferase domain-containing protein n=1 Tax=Paenirhodobacter sp. CAU 1674 TaxID=3032596 RepID=UPI0023DB1223|nr:methyltransferase domain-containing protein [Paenirhodobacter sp. CAU 1674]MDF2140355.1 methyltransferase domain-containing protein [Paenirhodobacter sp. CAU 1674]